MNKQIIIGKQGTQSFPITDPKVSRRHAFLVIDDRNNLTLQDNNSTNGTYIYNGTSFVRIEANRPYPVRPDTMIQLGPDTRFHVRRLIPAPVSVDNSGRRVGVSQGGGASKDEMNKKVDIRKLRLISDNYNKEKMDIESKTGMISGLNSLMILVSLLAGGGSKLLTDGADFGGHQLLWQTVISIGIAGVLVVTLLSFINIYKKRLMKRRNDNEHDYAVNYCCPNCKVSFRGKIYENILAERQCPRCKVKYYDSSEK